MSVHLARVAPAAGVLAVIAQVELKKLTRASSRRPGKPAAQLNQGDTGLPDMA